MGTDVNLKVYIDAYFTKDGVGLYISPGEGDFEEIIIPFNTLVKEYLDMFLIPSDPPIMHDTDRAEVQELCDNLLRAIDYLRKLEHDTPSWKENRLGR